MSQTEKLLAGISEKLDKVLKLLAVNTVKGINTEQEKIELLDLLGFRPVEIARLLNKSPDNINVQLSLIRKKKDKAMKTKTTEETQSQNVKSGSTTSLIEQGKDDKNEPRRE